MKLNNIGIIGIGSYAPDKIVTNEEIELLNIGTNSEWIFKKIGIKKRHIVNNELSSDLGYYAALNAINDSNLDKKDIDLIIVSTSSPDKISPSTASIISNKLDIKCPTFDINSVCSGFIYGLQISVNLIKTNEYKNILLIATETYSKITDWTNRNCVFFGDGAGAVIIAKNKNNTINTKIFGDGDGYDVFSCDHGKTFIMDGKRVFNFATEILPKTIKNFLEENKLRNNDISWIIPHQPSYKILDKTAKILQISTNKIVYNMENFGNTASASIPMALDNLYKNNLIKNNNILVLPAIGSGWTWGVSIIKYYR